MNQLASIRYAKNAGGTALFVRIRNLGQYWDFIVGIWVVDESANTRLFLAEYLDATDLIQSYYAVAYTKPAGGPYSVELVEISSGNTLDSFVLEPLVTEDPAIFVVDQDTGGLDNLRYTTADGTPVANAIILAFLKSDYDAQNYKIQAFSRTDVNGRWALPMYLPNNMEYTLVVYKVNAYVPSAVDLSLPTGVTNNRILLEDGSSLLTEDGGLLLQ